MVGPRQGELFLQVGSLVTRHPGVAWPARPLSLHLYSRHGAACVGGQGGPCTSWIFLCYAALFPQGNVGPPPQLPSPSALHTGAGPWSRGPGQAQPSPFCCTPLCPLSPCPASSRASKIIHWTYSTGPWTTPKAWPLAVPVPGVSISQGTRRR